MPRITELPAFVDQWSPFTIYPDGQALQEDAYFPAPEDVELEEDDDGSVPGEPEIDVWDVWHGWTQQYGYNGACMHPSEYLGGHMVDRMYEMAREDNRAYTFCVVAIATDRDPEPFAWCLAQFKE